MATGTEEEKGTLFERRERSITGNLRSQFDATWGLRKRFHSWMELKARGLLPKDIGNISEIDIAHIGTGRGPDKVCDWLDGKFTCRHHNHANELKIRPCILLKTVIIIQPRIFRRILVSCTNQTFLPSLVAKRPWNYAGNSDFLSSDIFLLKKVTTQEERGSYATLDACCFFFIQTRINACNFFSISHLPLTWKRIRANWRNSQMSAKVQISLRRCVSWKLSLYFCP